MEKEHSTTMKAASTSANGSKIKWMGEVYSTTLITASPMTANGRQTSSKEKEPFTMRKYLSSTLLSIIKIGTKSISTGSSMKENFWRTARTEWGNCTFQMVKSLRGISKMMQFGEKGYF